MNFLRESLRNLSYYRHTDGNTYATEIIYSAASRVVKYRILSVLSFFGVLMQKFVVVSFLLFYLQIQIIGFNSDLYNNMSHAQVSSNGIVIIALLAQV